MGLISTLRVSASGLSAERLRMDLIADNLANANTTRTPDGQPYRRKVAIFEPITPTPRMPGGVRVVQIAQDPSPPRMVYDPSHPDADPNGYVTYPNVDIVHEMVAGPAPQNLDKRIPVNHPKSSKLQAAKKL
jgi:flagellar basal-body rod protein FlgC